MTFVAFQFTLSVNHKVMFNKYISNINKHIISYF